MKIMFKFTVLIRHDDRKIGSDWIRHWLRLIPQSMTIVFYLKLSQNYV